MSSDGKTDVSQNVGMIDAEPSLSAKRKRTEKTSSTLSLITNAPNYQLDALTAHLHLRAALSQFLGLHGTAIPVDILKLHDNDVHIRVPNEDASAVVVAVGGWVGKAGEGWRVKSSTSWGLGLHSSSGAHLFK
ncbi:hypothetical protein E4T49_08390 [Aureobasidium sp. EXF-10728]|nr:hypothetical protein E4T49_08390 [Aureobasidium sp. EXF-10728]